jgi:hypothetical protein
VPNPFVDEHTTAKSYRAPVPCTKKRGFAHHTVYGDPEDGLVIGKCRYCRKKFERKASISAYEAWSAAVVMQRGHKK